MPLAPRFSRAVRQLFDNLNPCTPIEDLNRRSAPIARRVKNFRGKYLLLKIPVENYEQLKNPAEMAE
jgi:hypothetical protein